MPTAITPPGISPGAPAPPAGDPPDPQRKLSPDVLLVSVTDAGFLAGVGAFLAGLGALLSGVAALKLARKKGREE